MTYDIFLMRVMHRTGLDDRVLAQQLVLHTVEHLAQCLPTEHAELVAEELPEPLGTRLRDNAGISDCDLDALYRAVSDEIDLELSFAVEFTQVVFQVLGEAIGREGRARLSASLPKEWHFFFEPRRSASKPFTIRRDDRRTLANGQPGSSRPMSGARPGHRNSIALSEAPHSGTSLSTSQGKPASRTLAEGRPGSSRPLTDP